jgi:hypothetical protein
VQCSINGGTARPTQLLHRRSEQPNSSGLRALLEVRRRITKEVDVMNESSVFYQLGKRDCLADVLMLFRANPNEPIEIVRELAKQLLEVDPDNPHAKFWQRG